MRTAAIGCLLAVALAGCGGGSSTLPITPTSLDRLALPVGGYTFLAAATNSGPCTASPPQQIVSVTTRVELTHEGHDWVARSTSAADGDVEVRFHDDGSGGSNPLQGTTALIGVSGTVRGTARDPSGDPSALSVMTFGSTTAPVTLLGSAGGARNPYIVLGSGTGPVIFSGPADGSSISCSSIPLWSLQPRS